MGPVGGGKSTIVTLLKRGLEEYTRTDDGRGLRHRGLPDARGAAAPDPGGAARGDHEREYGIYIEGDLCPHCRCDLEHDQYDGRHRGRAGRSGSPSRRSSACGIGTFTPSRPEVPGHLRAGRRRSTCRRSASTASESDPRAYRFDGELNIANRGMMEFIEMLKCDEKFLYVLLTLSQEQNIKTGRFSMIYADEVIVSHTNENEYSVVRRQQEVRGAAGPHHPGEGAVQPAGQRRGADLREAARAERACRTCTSRRTRCASPASSRSSRGWSRRRRPA